MVSLFEHQLFLKRHNFTLHYVISSFAVFLFIYSETLVFCQQKNHTNFYMTIEQIQIEIEFLCNSRLHCEIGFRK